MPIGQIVFLKNSVLNVREAKTECLRKKPVKKLNYENMVKLT